MPLPKSFITALKAVPEKDLDNLCSIIKTGSGNKLSSKVMIEIFEKGDPIAIKQLHKSLAPALMIGGMMPGVGLACNIIDAAFCFTMGAWLDLGIDIIAIALCEVPGVSGLKGIAKGMFTACKSVRIDAVAFWKIMGKLKQSNLLKESKVHELFAFLLNPSNHAILFVDIKAIAQSLEHKNIFTWGPNIISKIAFECKSCSVIPTHY